MINKVQLLAFAMLCLCITSCSNDETPNTTLAGENGFEVNSTAYITDFIYLTSNEEIILSSRSLASGTTDGLNIVRFKTIDQSLTEITYTVDENLIECTAAINAIWEDGSIIGGQSILEEAQVVSGFMRVIDINRALQQIDIIFEFQRADGELVAGTYQGNFETATF